MGAWLTRWNLYRALGRDPGQPDLAGMRAERDALATADVVIGTSRWEWRLLRDQYGLPRARLVYDPIHPCFFDAPYVPAPRERFLCVAISQGHTRGFRIASEAARRAGVRMVAVDSKPRTEMPAVYDSALALVLPTAFAQGFDLTIAEGRARGVPAIMTPTGSYLDEAEPWDRLVELGDVEGLAEVLKIKWPAAPHEGAADRHRPEAHVKSWLGTIA
jgi:glycosyltransferase involved in cell wall biosynthesis